MQNSISYITIKSGFTYEDNFPLSLLKYLRWLLPRLFLLIFSSLLLIGIGEWATRRYVIYSHPFVNTLMYQRWVERYGGTYNSLGYRDKEWASADFINKQHVVISGDSFADGIGLNNRADRFGDQLAQNLGDDYALSLVAYPGWSQRHILFSLHTYPFDFDALVMSYYINDIEVACKVVTGLVDPFTTSEVAPPDYLQGIVERSHLADLLYWNFYARIALYDRFAEWSQIMEDCYTNPAVWDYHAAELRSIYNLARIRGVPFAVVIFPDLMDLDRLDESLDKVRQLYTDLGVPVVDLREQWRDYSLSDRIVSPFDNHAGEKLHHEVGEQLAALDILRSPDTYQPSPLQLDDLLLPSVYAAYQEIEADIDFGEGIIFNPATQSDKSLEIATFLANTGFYDPQMTTEDQREAYRFIAAWERQSLESDLDLSLAQQSALNTWRHTKAAADLHAAGINMILTSVYWDAWLSIEEYAALYESGDYEIIGEWGVSQPLIYYRLLRVVAP